MGEKGAQFPPGPLKNMEGKKDPEISKRDPMAEQQVLKAARESLARGANRMGLDVADYVKAISDGTLPSRKGLLGILQYLRLYQRKNN